MLFFVFLFLARVIFVYNIQYIHEVKVSHLYVHLYGVVHQSTQQAEPGTQTLRSVSRRGGGGPLQLDSWKIQTPQKKISKRTSAFPLIEALN